MGAALAFINDSLDSILGANSGVCRSISESQISKDDEMDKIHCSTGCFNWLNLLSCGLFIMILGLWQATVDVNKFNWVLACECGTQTVTVSKSLQVSW